MSISSWGKAWGSAFGTAFGVVAIIKLPPYEQPMGVGYSEEDQVATQIHLQNNTLIQLFAAFIASGEIYG